MEILIELLIELFGEIIIQALVALFSHFSGYIHANTKAKRILKNIISILIFSSSLILLFYAIKHKQNLYTKSVLIYFFIIILLYILRYIAQGKEDYILIKRIIWITRICHYAFPIAMIITTAINFDKASISIIIISSITLFIYLAINCYRLVN